MKGLRIVFMGTPDFATAILRKLDDGPHDVVGVVTAPDRQAGRGQKLRASSVKSEALLRNLPILQPKRLRHDGFHAALKALKADLFIVVAFRMLPESVWSMPNLGTVNLHASLLPAYRGAAPINWAIMNGEEITGLTTFMINERIDEGAILLQEEMSISADEDAGSLHDRMMVIGSELVEKTVDGLASGTLSPRIQPMESSYPKAPKLTPSNRRIDWSLSAERIRNHIRGLSPYPAAWTVIELPDGQSIDCKIFKVSVLESSDIPCGTIRTDEKTFVHAGTNNQDLSIEELQLSGKRRMGVRDLLNGFTFPEGSRFSG